MAAALQVEPALDFDLRWENGDTDLYLTPIEPLEPQQAFTVTVTQDAKDETGQKLAKFYRWRYRAAPLMGEVRSGATPGPESPIRLRFNYALQPWSVERAFSLEPRTAGQAAFDLETRTLTFTPAITLTSGTEYTWRFDRPVWDLAGRPILVDLQGQFRTEPLVAFATSTGETGAALGGGLTLHFSQPVDPGSVEAGFTLRPRTAGEFVWESADTLVFVPTGGFWAASTTYTVQLAPTLRLADGRPGLDATVGHTFRTEAARRLATFGTGAAAQVVDAQGSRGVQFVYDGNARTAQANFNLRAVTLADFMAHAMNVDEPYSGEPKPMPDLSRYPVVASWSFSSDLAALPKNQYWMDRRLETSLPADVAPGLYVLELATAGLSDDLWISLTTLAIQARRADHQVLAWVTDINGAPAPDATVTVHAEDGQTLATAVSDASGLARLDVDADEAHWVFAELNGDRTVAGLDSDWTGQSYWYWWSQPARTEPNAYITYITTDRPIYRPGDTLRFKAVVRQDDDGALSLFAEKQITVRLRDARDNIVRTIYLTTDAYGAVDSLFRLAEGAMLGAYHIEVIVDGESTRRAFEVEAYQKPEIAVEVGTDADVYVDGETIHGTVDSRYFFDAPVADANVAIRMYDVTTYCDWGGYCGEPQWHVHNRGVVSGVTDATGRFAFSLPATSDLVNPQGANYARTQIGIEATVTDDSGVPVSAHRILDLYQSSVQLSWLNGIGTVKPGAVVTARARVTDLGGDAVSGQSAQLELRRWNERDFEYSEVVNRADLTSDSVGQFVTALELPRAGFYQVRLTVKGAQGHPATIDTWAWAYTGAEARPGYASTFDVSADRDAYAPGDQALLTIQSVFSGPALLSIGRTGLLREEVVTLTAPSTQVVVPILPGDAPNLNVSVSAWQPVVDAQGELTAFDPEALYSRSESLHVSDQVVLNVPAVDKQLTIAITPDQAHYGAGDTATFDLRVTAANGQPVQAQLTLALVDESIFSLSGENAGAIFDAFYFQRATRVTDFHSFMPSRYLALFGGDRGGGGGGGAAFGLLPRSRFADTAFWEPSLVTDADGHAHLTVTLPDTLTTWRLTARAITTDTQVGEAVAQIVTQEDLIVRPLLPTTLTAGDSLDLSVIVHNNTDITRTIVVGMLAPDGIRLLDPLTRTVEAPASSTVAVGWRAQALTAGDRRLTFWAQDPADRAVRDAVELPLTVHALAVPDVSVQVGVVRDTRTLTVTASEGLLEQSQLELTLSGSVAGNITDGLDYLTGYPYGCVEQTMSRALPNAVVARAFRELGLDEALDSAELPRKIDASVQRLYGFQHDDGGWGWWTDDATDPYQTAWVIFGLNQTREAGYEVDPAVIERGAAYLTSQLPTLDRQTRAFVLYSLALAGHGDLQVTQTAARRAAQLSAFSQASLALTLWELGDEQGAREVLDRLMRTAVRQDGLAHWNGAETDGHYHAKTMASTTRSTALALSALLALAPDDPLVAESVRYLMSQRRADGWGSTNETSFTILALTDYVVARERQNTQTRFTISVNGVEVAQGALGAGQLTARVVVPADALRAGPNAIAVTASGGPLFYSAVGRWFTQAAHVPAAGAITVTRNFALGNGRAATDTFVAGDVVRVNLTVDLPRDGAFMLIEDSLSGGLAPINERLNTSSYDSRAATSCNWSGDCDLFLWDRLGYNQKEIRDDRVSFFVTQMTQGAHTFSYLARALRSGRFTALPATASAMYDATLWGRSASSILEVSP